MDLTQACAARNVAKSKMQQRRFQYSFPDVLWGSRAPPLFHLTFVHCSIFNQWLSFTSQSFVSPFLQCWEYAQGRAICK